MSRIGETFARLRREGHKGFIPYVTAGDPDLKTTAELVAEMERRGADVVELGIPFSDPLADGPTNQASAQRALEKGICLEDILSKVADIRSRTDVPLVLFTYFNPVHRYGLERFVDRCADTGVDGALVTDLPPEEAKDFRGRMHARGMDTVFLVAPTSREIRIRLIAEASTGFIYYVSRAGVTGEQSRLADRLEPMVQTIRRFTRKPVAVGFGISTPEQAAQVARIADAVVVGSAIVRRIGEKGGDPDLVSRIGAFVESLARPLKQGEQKPQDA